MRRSIGLSIGLLVPLVLLVLLFGSVLSLAATSVVVDVADIPGFEPGDGLSAAQGTQSVSLTPDGPSPAAPEPGMFWGRESMSRDEEFKELRSWLANLPPRPQAEIRSSSAMVQASAMESSSPGFQWPDQTPRGGPPPSAGSEYQAHLDSATQAAPAIASPSTAEAVDSSATAHQTIEASTVITLELVHRGTDSAAFSSSFVITNTAASLATCVFEFHWPNGQFIGSDMLILDPGQALEYFMDAAPFGDQTFVGYVVISSDQPIEGRILTPDYGLISGIVYEPGGTIPLQTDGIAVHRWSDDVWFGGTYSMSDGRFFVGGLPDDSFAVYFRMPYPWASQWYDGKTSRDQADPIVISGAEETPIEVIIQPGGRITGTVYASDGTTRLENVNVDVEQGGFGACTDVNGDYVLEGLPFGDYKVVASRGMNFSLGEQSTWIVEYYQESFDPDGATVLTLGEGNDTIPDIDFTLDEGGRITGTVFASDGVTRLENVNVQIAEEGYGTCTDADGHYAIIALPYDDYRVRAGGGWNWCLDQDSEYLVEYYQETSDTGAATVLPISASSLSHEDIDFALDEGGQITGTVFAEDGVTRLENVNVDIEEGGFGTCTNSSGEYTIVGLPYGDYRVRAGGDWNWCLGEPSAYAMEYWREVYSYQEATLVSVSGTPQGGIDFTMEPGGYITGTVSNTEGMPVEGVTVAAVILGDCPWCQQWVTSANTDSNGDYTLGPLPPLDVTVYACPSCSGHLYLDEWYDDVGNIQDATFLSVTLGTTVPNIDIVLDPGVLVTGTITVPEGYPAEGIQVNIWQQNDGGYGTIVYTDASGIYRAPVPPIYDDYWMMLVQPWGTDLGAQWLYGFDLSRQTEWDFDLGPGATIAGTITSGGMPVPNAHVEANSLWLALGGQADADGNYEIANLLPGEYRVYAAGGPDHVSVYYGGVYNREWHTPLWLETGEFLSGVDIDITPLGRLDGTVYESDGTTPIQGVFVVAMNDGGFWEDWTGVDGTFHMDVPAGDFRVSFKPGSGLMTYYGGSHSYATADVVTVPPYFPDENSTTLTMNLETTATLDGTVRDSTTGDPVAGVMVAVEVRDPEVDGRFSFWSGCTEETGQYHIEGIWPGENQVWAAGTCSGNDYGMVTDTFEADPGGHHVLDLYVTAESVPSRPFTIRAYGGVDFTPLSYVGVPYMTEVDEILPALFTPLAELNDQNEWVSQLLVQVPTLDNGGAVVVGDRLEVTYELLPGLLWSDGAPLTSSDIRFTWELVTQPSPETDRWVASVNPLWQIEGIDTPDSLTAVVTYRPDYFPPGFEGAINYLMPEHVLAGEHRVDVRWYSDYAHYPVGNGPYTVVDYMPGSHLDLRANPNYGGRGEGLPAIEEVRFLFTNYSTYVLPNGAADVALDVDPGVYGELDIPTHTRIKSTYHSIVPNTDLPFFEDVRVRRALYYALDRDRYIAGYSAHDVKADAYLPSGHPMFTDTLVRYSFDLSTAASLLEAAGWTDTDANGIRDKDGIEFEFDLTYPTGDDARQGLCLIWQEDLATIGVDVNCVPMEWNDLVLAGRRGELEAYTMGWGFESWYDPMGYYLFHSRSVPSAYNIWTGGPMNRWADPDPDKTDAWLEAARTELDPDSMRGYYADHLARFTDQVPSWVYSHDTRTDAYIPVLHNFGPGQATPATWNIEEWTLEPNPYDLAVRKRLAAGSPAPQPDTTITYEIQVHNYGTQPVSNATLVDILPGEVVFDSATPTPDSQTGSVLTWNLGDIPAATSAAPVRVTVQIPAEVEHGTILTNSVEVYGDEADTHPANNGFVYTVEVRDDVDIAVTKAGVGQAAIGAEYTYLIDYANWGGAPVEGVVLTDTLPAEVTFLDAEPYPTAVNGLELTWALPTLLGNQWGGQILVTTEIAATGTVVNTAEIGFAGIDADPGNNVDLASEDVDEILAPIITQPTQGTTGGEPLFRGLAPSSSTVELWDLSAGITSLGSTVATSLGTWELPLALAEGTYSIAAKATKAGLTSDYSNSATIVVKHDLPLDTNAVSVTANDVDISRGVVEADRRTLGYRTLFIKAEIPCDETPEPRLRVIESALWNYILLPLSMTEVDAGLWEVTFRLWMSDPHSTYDIWLDWDCGGVPESVRLLSVVIDPDGYVYDDSLVSAGALIADSLMLDAEVTAYVWRPDLEQWEIWSAGSYGQFNPQWTDGTTPDGVLEEGYYSFLTPPGQYRIVVEAPGYQPYQSAVLTVINEPIHLDIPLRPVVGGGGDVVAPANLGESSKQVDRHDATKNDLLTYDIWLVNSGEWDTGDLTLTDAIPDNTTYVDGSLSWSGGGSAEYSGAMEAVAWSGVVPCGAEVHISFQVRVTSDEGAPFDIHNVALVDGPPENLSALPALSATTTIEARGFAIYLPVVLRNH